MTLKRQIASSRTSRNDINIFYWMEKLDLKSGTALVIVAHPDDETIWMGGTMLSFPQVEWTIFSLCRASDADRAPKYLRVCRQYSAQAIITDLEDEGAMSITKSVPKIKKLIEEQVGREHFDYIFTHDKNGEYGHMRHVGVNHAVTALIKEKKLTCGRLLHFAYRVNARKKVFNRDDADYFVALAPKIHAAKRDIVTKLYGFSPHSFEAVSCLDRETFIINS
jgi:LmbE family N-acetylglucosaminyl deacetylase